LELRDGKLVWSVPEFTPPEAGTVELWDGWVDDRGGLRVAAFTQSRHLLYCRTSDGKRWRRQALSRVDRTDVRMSALAMGQDEAPSLFYLLEGEGVPAAVHLSCPQPEQWQARRWPLPEGGVRFGAMTERGPMLLGRRGGRTCLWLENAEKPLAAFPGEVRSSFALDGHLLVNAEGAVCCDGLPLGAGDGVLGLYRDQNGLAALWEKERSWVKRTQTETGWKDEEPLSAPPELCLSARGREFRPVSAATPRPLPPTDRLAQLEARVRALEEQMR